MTWPERRMGGRCLLAALGMCLVASTLQAQSVTVDLADPRIGPPDNPANINSTGPSISANGRFIAFFCYASNIVPADTNGAADVFVVDRLTLAAHRVSVSSSGAQANGASLNPKLSGTGRWVVFQSLADNLVPGDTNGQPDILLHDRATAATTRVNLSSLGSPANGASADPVISREGSCVAFASAANNLVSRDSNGASDIFVRDLALGLTTCVSTNLLGSTGNNYSQDPAISADGRFVAFESLASDLALGDTNDAWDIFVRDRALGVTERISVSSDGVQGNGFSTDPWISGDGRYVSFLSAATNLVPGDTNGKWDCFVFDRLLLTIARVSGGNGSVQGNGAALACELSDDGQFAIFRSFSSNLVTGDTNAKSDIFVRDIPAATVTRISLSESGQQANDNSHESSISQHGEFQVFISQATNLDPAANAPQVYRVFSRGMAMRLPGDFNGDGHIDGADIAVYLGLYFNPPLTLPELDLLDVDGNGAVDDRDLSAFTDSLLTGS